MKYLGVIFDSKLKFNEHIQYTADRCTALINALSRSARLNWGLGPKALRIMYEGAILPLLSYASPVWVEALSRLMNCRRYKRVQRLMNIKIAKAYRTTSYEALCVLTGLTPIIIKIQEIAEGYKYLKSKDAENIVDIPVSYKNWSHPAEFQRIRESNVSKDYAVEVFTDGSKSEYGVGSGIVVFINAILECQMRFKLADECSNNQAEQLAILRALEKIEEIQDIQRMAVIHTDSRITLDSLKNSKNHNYLIEEIRQKIKTLQFKDWTIDFGWVRAHAGTYGNEVADRLAKQAARVRETVSYSKIPKCAVMNRLRRASGEKWEAEWQQTTKGTQTRQYFPNIRQRLATKLPVSPNFTAMLTGHGKVKAYYYRFKITEDAVCTCGSGEQTVDHLLWECTELSGEREKLRRKTSEKGARWPISKIDLVQKFTKDFFNFCNAIEFPSA